MTISTNILNLCNDIRNICKPCSVQFSCKFGSRDMTYSTPVSTRIPAPFLKGVRCKVLDNTIPIQHLRYNATYSAPVRTGSSAEYSMTNDNFDNYSKLVQ